MGNQARVAPNSTVVSTSTRNFPNRLGQGADVYLASSELAAVSAALGKIPTMEEYMSYMGNIDTLADNIYRYLNFNEIQSYMDAAERAKSIPLTSIQEVAV
jgi:aconitate hydratase 2/2-methylisocitrate dehydratase